jgi:hypothetical protein
MVNVVSSKGYRVGDPQYSSYNQGAESIGVGKVGIHKVKGAEFSGTPEGPEYPYSKEDAIQSLAKSGNREMARIHHRYVIKSAAWLNVRAMNVPF